MSYDGSYIKHIQYKLFYPQRAKWLNQLSLCSLHYSQLQLQNEYSNSKLFLNFKYCNGGFSFPILFYFFLMKFKHKLWKNYNDYSVLFVNKKSN